MNTKDIKILEKFLNMARAVDLLKKTDTNKTKHDDLIGEHFYMSCLPGAEDLFLSLCGEIGVSVLWDFEKNEYELKGKKP